MGKVIRTLEKVVEKISKDRPLKLRLGGFILTIVVVLISGLSGWSIERVSIAKPFGAELISQIPLIIGLSSAIAAGSLRKAVFKVLLEIDKTDEITSIRLEKAKKALRKIVGRDVNNLNESEILRATAETASENSVDGIFAPLFWMFVGVILWRINPILPGPLAMAWMFKASSTIDSMLGYKFGSLKWMGTAGARLDDFLTWIPCRLVLLSLPLISKPWKEAPTLIRDAIREGSLDSSPNSGISEAIFAHCGRVKMGGENYYRGKKIYKSILAKNAPAASIKSVKRIVNISLRLEISWILLSIVLEICINRLWV